MAILADSALSPAGALPKAQPFQRRLRNQPKFQDDGQAVFQGNVIIESGGIVQRSPDGHYWSESIDNAGVLSTTDEGTVSPADA